MTRAVFIAGTDTGVGKTRVSVALLRALGRRDISANGMKPIATGAYHDLSRDPRLAQNGEDRAIIADDTRMIFAHCAQIDVIEDVTPYSFEAAVSPHIAARRAGVTIDLDRIAAAFGRLCEGCDAVVVEGTGGWYAPIGEATTMADLALRLGLPVVLVVGLRLGCLNHALLSQQAIEACGLEFAGWMGSVLDRELNGLDENIASLDQRLHAPRLALLPHCLASERDCQHVSAAVEKLFINPPAFSRQLSL